MATVEITWRGVRPVSPEAFAFDLRFAKRHAYPVFAWRDTNKQDRAVVLTRMTTPSGLTVALYETEEN